MIQNKPIVLLLLILSLFVLFIEDLNIVDFMTVRSPVIVTEGSELKCSDVFLKEKEAHKFIKEVVKAGKVIRIFFISLCVKN